MLIFLFKRISFFFTQNEFVIIIWKRQDNNAFHVHARGKLYFPPHTNNGDQTTDIAPVQAREAKEKAKRKDNGVPRHIGATLLRSIHLWPLALTFLFPSVFSFVPALAIRLTSDRIGSLGGGV